MQENDTLQPKQLRAITALLSQPTIRDAAKDCGVSETTLWRWLNDEAFQLAYRKARRQVVEQAMSELQSACSDAVACLRRNLKCGTANVEVSAAKTILDQAVKAIEFVDMEERLEQLERVHNSTAQKKGIAK
jgi:DNA-binding LacI/PurR family transcriptional regulator